VSTQVSFALTVLLWQIVSWSFADSISCDFRTIFTGAKRHTYIDPDYSYTDTEAKQIQQNKKVYLDLLDELRKKRRGHLQAM